MLPYITIGSLSIPSGAFFWIIGIILCLIFYVASHKVYGYKWYTALLLGGMMIILEIFGAKSMYYLQNPSAFGEPISWTSGYSLYGVFYFTPLFVFLVTLVMKTSFYSVMDFLAPGIMIELALYRIGCMCAGCCYGIEVGWGITNGATDGLFPVQPLEAGLDLLLFALIFFLFVKKRLLPGEAFLSTFLGYSILRFGLEFLRHRTNVVGPLSVSHLLALGQIVGATVWIVVLHVQNRRRKDCGQRILREFEETLTQSAEENCVSQSGDNGVS